MSLWSHAVLPGTQVVPGSLKQRYLLNASVTRQGGPLKGQPQHFDHLGSESTKWGAVWKTCLCPQGHHRDHPIKSADLILGLERRNLPLQPQVGITSPLSHFQLLLNVPTPRTAPCMGTQTWCNSCSPNSLLFASLPTSHHPTSPLPQASLPLASRLYSSGAAIPSSSSHGQPPLGPTRRPGPLRMLLLVNH
jgi:hypothetical protein